MHFEIDLIFRSSHGYDDLVARVLSNPRFVFEVWKQDKIDKRTRKSKEKGWVELRHKQHGGFVKLSKESGVCSASVNDESGGLKLIGAWISWLGSNAADLLSGLDVRFK